MEPTLEEKRQFLKWFIKNNQLHKREALWILNYLYNHEFLLRHVHFVEGAHLTPKGLMLTTVDYPDLPPFVFTKFGKQYTDPEMAFHEIRMDWQDHIYVELVFPKHYETMQRFGVLEENVYNDEEVPRVSEERIDALFNQAQRAHQIDQLKHEIDQALIDGDADAFRLLTDTLAKLQQE